MTKEIYIFKKSGSRVVIVSKEFKLKTNSKNNGVKCVSVKRVDSGKAMIVPVSSLIKEKEMEQ